MNYYHKSLQINVTPLFDLSSKAGRLQRDWYMNEGRFFEEGGLPRGVAGQMIWPVVAAAGNAGIGALDVVRLVTEKNSICGAAAHRIIGLLAEMVELDFQGRLASRGKGALGECHLSRRQPKSDRVLSFAQATASWKRRSTDEPGAQVL